MACPICRKPVDRDSQFVPFCSERCKLIDLGNWATERYRIPGTLTEEDLVTLSDEEVKKLEGSNRPDETGERED
jgi:uncharacterized protein